MVLKMTDWGGAKRRGRYREVFLREDKNLAARITRGNGCGKRGNDFREDGGRRHVMKTMAEGKRKLK